MSGPILVTGAGGFVGSAVVAALDDTKLRLLAHRRDIAALHEIVHADLTDAAMLAGVCDGVSTVVHLASEVGRDAERCQAVNVLGTRNLLAEAERAGVRDVIYVSTAAVHGRGPHRDLDESATPAPVSVASRSRYLAEQAVRAAGGVVLRPFYTYGEGDRWFVPTLLKWLRTRPRVWLDGGSARQSVVAVEDLAAVVAAAAHEPAAFVRSPLHVCEPEPVRMRDALLALAGMFGMPHPWISVPGNPVRGALRRLGQHQLERRMELISVEHTYRSERAWRAAAVTPGPPMLTRLDRHAAWYRQFAAA